jgi:hypothetical protein
MVNSALDSELTEGIASTIAKFAKDNFFNNLGDDRIKSFWDVKQHIVIDKAFW